MTKHSPGPWKLSAYSNETMNPEFLVTESNTNDWPIIVAEVNSEENARLIAAAPDLLEALQSVHQWMDDQADAQSKGGHATFDLMMLREQRDKARAAIARATHKEQT